MRRNSRRSLHNPKWGVSKDLNNPKRLFTTGPVRADRSGKYFLASGSI
jgi:hypothetical protein